MDAAIAVIAGVPVMLMYIDGVSLPGAIGVLFIAVTWLRFGIKEYRYMAGHHRWYGLYVFVALPVIGAAAFFLGRPVSDMAIAKVFVCAYLLACFIDFFQRLARTAGSVPLSD
jgi:hypothetical protein